MIAEPKDLEKLIKAANHIGFKLVNSRFTKIEGCIREETLTLVGWKFIAKDNDKYMMEEIKKKA